MNRALLFQYSLIAFIGSLLFVPFLGQLHLFDWDEINFAECAREMLVSGDYLRVQIDFSPFWEKPPLFIWMQALSMHLFGINEFAARFPNAFMGVLTLLTLFYAGRRVANDRVAFWWVLLYACSWLPHFYFKSGIIDPTFNYFIFLAFFQLHLVRGARDPLRHALFAGLALGLAVLTKGPVAALIAMLAFVVFVFLNKGLWGYRVVDLVIVAFAACIPFFAWFGAAILQHGWTFGSWFINEFVTYQIRLFQTEDADHGGPFFYHFIVLLIGCFPASAFLFAYRPGWANQAVEGERQFSRWMWILFWVTLILFSIVKTKIVHYSSLCYFPLTFLAAAKVAQLEAGNRSVRVGIHALLLVIGSLLGLLIALLPIVGIYKRMLIPVIDDPFAVGNLAAPVEWAYAEMIWGLLYVVGIWSAVLMMRKQLRNGMILLAVVQIAFMQITILHFTPKIEAFSQRAAIQYFKSFRGRDVYVHVLGYKSYAQLFYGDKQPAQKLPPGKDEQWLLQGDVDKPVYFICKVTSAQAYRQMPGLTEIGDKNGFVFFRRDRKQ